MSVSYKKLWIRIIEQDMTNTQLREKAKISGSTFTKLKRNEYVSLESLERMAGVLDCEIGDLLEIAKNDSKKS